MAPRVDTSLGSLPGPGEVAGQGIALWGEYRAVQADKADFYARQDAINADRRQSGQPEQNFTYAGAPTFPDQIFTSLYTVAMGFVLATLVAVRISSEHHVKAFFRLR